MFSPSSPTSSLNSNSGNCIWIWKRPQHFGRTAPSIDQASWVSFSALPISCRAWWPDEGSWYQVGYLGYGLLHCLCGKLIAIHTSFHSGLNTDAGISVKWFMDAHILRWWFRQKFGFNALIISSPAHSVWMGDHHWDWSLSKCQYISANVVKSKICQLCQVPALPDTHTSSIESSLS